MSEASILKSKSAEALERLAALTAVVAVRLMQLRDWAQAATSATDSEPKTSSNPAAELRAVLPNDWVLVVSHLARCQPDALTPRLFWLTLAKRGGFIGCKSDGVPGWQTIWKGWSEVLMIVQGFELHRAIHPEKSFG